MEFSHKKKWKVNTGTIIKSLHGAFNHRLAMGLHIFPETWTLRYKHSLYQRKINIRIKIISAGKSKSQF